MTLTVTFSGLDGEANYRTKGSLSWDGKEFRAEGDPTLVRLTRLGIYGQHGKYFEADKDPEGFMENLCYQYRSYPFMASRAVRTD